MVPSTQWTNDATIAKHRAYMQHENCNYLSTNFNSRCTFQIHIPIGSAQHLNDTLIWQSLLIQFQILNFSQFPIELYKHQSSPSFPTDNWFSLDNTFYHSAMYTINSASHHTICAAEVPKRIPPISPIEFHAEIAKHSLYCSRQNNMNTIKLLPTGSTFSYAAKDYWPTNWKSHRPTCHMPIGTTNRQNQLKKLQPQIPYLLGNHSV